MWEKICTFIAWCIALLMAWLGSLSLKDLSTIVGLVMGVVMVLISWYYKHQTYRLLADKKITREEYDAANR